MARLVALDRPARRSLARARRARRRPRRDQAGPRSARWRAPGASSGAYVVDLGTGAELYASKADVAPHARVGREALHDAPRALLRYGADGHLTTSVLADGLPGRDRARSPATSSCAAAATRRSARAAAAALAKQLADAGLHARSTGRVIGDESAFDAFRGVPASGYRLTSEVGPLSALAFNHGRTGKAAPYFQASPAQFAAQAFEKALEQRGREDHRHRPRRPRARRAMTPLSEWESPPIVGDRPPDEPALGQLHRRDADQGPRRAVRQRRAPPPPAATVVARRRSRQLRDHARRWSTAPASRAPNRTTPREVVQLLTGMDESEAGVAFDESLAVAGRNGTLYNRMRGTAAQDRCHAKTGTLHDVSALAGYCNTTGGERVAFAFLMNRV